MSNIYLIENDGYDFKWLALDVIDFKDKLTTTHSQRKLIRFSYHNLSLSDGWTDIHSYFTQNPEKEDLPIPDISLWLVGPSLALSPKAFDVLHDVLMGFGEFLPVKCNNEIFHIFNCRTMIDADEKQSKYIIESGEVVDIESIGFEESLTNGINIFKTSFDNCAQLYCNESFKKVVDMHNLKGICFSRNLLPAFN